jgi:hypothetical protein
LTLERSKGESLFLIVLLVGNVVVVDGVGVVVEEGEVSEVVVVVGVTGSVGDEVTLVSGIVFVSVVDVFVGIDG